MSTPLENWPPWALETAWVLLAVATHAALLVAMPKVPAGVPDPSDSEPVVVAIVEETEPAEPEPAEEELEPADPEPAEPEPVKPPPKPKTFRAPKEPPKELLEEPPAAAPETPVAFDNIVLTNEGDEPSDWAMDPGSGESREGPIGRPDAVVTGRSKEGVVGGILGGTGIGVVVDVGDLSRQPIPPTLKQKLERVYPKKARQEGIGGRADARLSVGPDGKPVTTRVTFRCGYENRY